MAIKAVWAAFNLCSLTSIYVKSTHTDIKLIFKPQVADIGEVSWILNGVGAYYADLNSSDPTSEDYYFGWSSPWTAQAEYNQQLASNTSLDNLSRMYTYFKAANYFFTGTPWPYIPVNHDNGA